ncbi:MAG: hypothetical protein R3E35_01325 [Rhodocyclaceae bacterium]
MDSPIALAFVERYPDAGERRPTGSQTHGLRAQHAYCGRRTAENCWNACIVFIAGTGELEADAGGRTDGVASPGIPVSPSVEQIRSAYQRIEHHIASPDDAAGSS